MKVVLASGNAGKLRELSVLLNPLGFELVTQAALGIEGAEEPAVTFVENALLKARHASRLSGLPAIADDSGLSVPALNGAPGVRSSRYAGDTATDADNNARLVAELAELALDTAAGRAAAHFDCVMVYLAHPEDPTPIIASGRWHGRILDRPRGDNGFGYDPHFYLEDLDATAAELDPARKNRLSHRGQAARALAAALTTARTVQ